MSVIIDKFISEFEEKFGKYLQPATHLEAKEGQTISHTAYFSVIHPTLKFSDWDLECRIIPGGLGLAVLEEMYEYIHNFSKFQNVGDFVGNGWFQIMAFLPQETTGPFVDVHVQGVEGELKKDYFQRVLDFPKAEQQTIDWLVITWFRKVKNKNKEANKFRNGWLKKYLTPKQYEESGSNPGSFFSDYFSSRDYNDVVNFLK